MMHSSCQVSAVQSLWGQCYDLGLVQKLRSAYYLKILNDQVFPLINVFFQCGWVGFIRLKL